MTATFSKKSTSDEVLAGLDLSGRTYVLTGCASGIGFETMRALAARGAHVIGTARSLERARQACERVPGHTTPIACDQDDFAETAAAARTIRALDMRLDGIIANAGIMMIRTAEVRYGVESQFRVNHLAHMLLITRIADLLHDGTGRLVMVSSSAQSMAPAEGVAFDNLDAHEGYRPLRCYGQSKLANAAFAKTMAERLASRGITSNALHPGVILSTDLSRSVGVPMSLAIPVMRLFSKSIPQGAATSCYLAAHPDVGSSSGGFYADCAPAKTHAMVNDPAFRQRLWDVSDAILTANAPAA